MECQNVHSLSREALLRAEPVIIVAAGQVHLPDRRAALGWMQTLLALPDTLPVTVPG